MRNILVTGANSGIGFALVKQLVAKEYSCRVFLGSRSTEKGKAAAEAILKEQPEAKIDVIQIDVGSDSSVAAAAVAVNQLLAGGSLYGVVNNAGTGLAHQGVTCGDIMNVNFQGPQRVVNAFLPHIDKQKGRIVNVGSGAGPMYVNKRVEAKDSAAVKLLTSWSTTPVELDDYVQSELKSWDDNKEHLFPSYGLSKAALSVYTMCLVKQFKKDGLPITVSCLSPGFIATAIVAGFGASKPPEEGTVSIRHCLFADLQGNGFYYGSDAVRSPLHKVRNPGEEEYVPTGDALAEEHKFQ